MKTMKEMAQEALDIQDACNLSGVVHAFARLLPDLRARLEEMGEGGTDKVNQHPVSVMFSSKIASLTGSENNFAFRAAYDWVDMEAFRAQLKAERFIHEKIAVSPEAKAKLPDKSVIMGFVWAHDMGGDEHKAMLVRFYDKGMRVAYFRVDNGDYLGDYIL